MIAGRTVLAACAAALVLLAVALEQWPLFLLAVVCAVLMLGAPRQ